MSEPCAIWKSRTYDSNRGVIGDRFQYDSPRASGKYEITGSAKALVGFMSERQKAYLTTWLVDQHHAGNEWPVVTGTKWTGLK
ncbi:hypothetical protein FHS21_006397 [Phyllobacterium trifolii]|jgi:hypothetical protein|uniref:Uncharacterized protein n=1 Tax=Phyllobacterium trifolii TaxID=300193 RepID=A0A839UFI6_9HYPH|nr:hypothetical protein [Phyllobacterium trifolii]